MTVAVDESAEYRAFLAKRGLSELPPSQPLIGMMRRLIELDELEERCAAQIEAATDRMSKRRLDNKLGRYEAERLRLYDQIDHITNGNPDVQLAIYAAVVSPPPRPRFAPGPTRFTPVPDHDLTEEDD